MLLYKMYETKSSLRDNSHVFEDITYVIDSACGHTHYAIFHKDKLFLKYVYVNKNTPFVNYCKRHDVYSMLWNL